MAIFGFDISYKVRGEDDELAVQKMQVAFERAGEGFEKFGSVLFPKLTPLLEEEIGGQFEQEGRGPNRGGWAALSPAYALQKERLYPGMPKLVATGTMRAALTEASSGNALRVETSTRFQFGTQGVEYASFHQSGTSRMPDRPPFDFTEQLEQGIQRASAEAAREVARDSGVTDFATWRD